MNSDDIDSFAWDCEHVCQDLADWANKHPDWFTVDAVTHMVQARAYLQVAIENASKKP